MDPGRADAMLLTHVGVFGKVIMRRSVPLGGDGSYVLEYVGVVYRAKRNLPVMW